jgi:hypothetical protein
MNKKANNHRGSPCYLNVKVKALALRKASNVFHRATRESWGGYDGARLELGSQRLQKNTLSCLRVSVQDVLVNIAVLISGYSFR